MILNTFRRWQRVRKSMTEEAEGESEEEEEEEASDVAIEETLEGAEEELLRKGLKLNLS